MNEIIKESVSKHDLDYHRYMLIEEMSELTKELCKDRRGKDNLEHIAEEIADVQIMMEQLMIAYNCQDLVDTFYNMKLNRLKRRIDLI